MAVDHRHTHRQPKSHAAVGIASTTLSAACALPFGKLVDIKSKGTAGCYAGTGTAAQPHALLVAIFPSLRRQVLFTKPNTSLNNRVIPCRYAPGVFAASRSDYFGVALSLAGISSALSCALAVKYQGR
jgi:hypothetical protein